MLGKKIHEFWFGTDEQKVTVPVIEMPRTENPEDGYNYYLAFPVVAVNGPFRTLVQTDVYWGSSASYEDAEFVYYYAHTFSRKPFSEDTKNEILTKCWDDFQFKYQMAGRCMRFLSRR